jgi:DNA-binding winged helix-turn-helix (wHTH) protein
MNKVLIVGSWRVDLQHGWMARRNIVIGRRKRPDARLLQVLQILIDNAGRTVSTEKILQSAWPDRVVSRDSVTTAIYQLRQLLGDTADNPQYIASQPRRGYRLIATVRPASQGRSQRVAGALTACTAIAAMAAWFLWPASDQPEYIFVQPMQNYAESPVQGPLFSAIESTFLSELIQTFPGRVRTEDADDISLRLESMMVACDLGPTLVMRLLDTRRDTYIWSEAYNLEEAATTTERPTLVEKAAMDVGAAIL